MDVPKIAKELKITDEQKKKMAEARASFVRDRQKLVAATVDQYREKLQEIAKASDQKVLDALSKKQQEQFKKMKGKMVDLGKPAFRGLAKVVPAPGRPVPKKPAPKKP